MICAGCSKRFDTDYSKANEKTDSLDEYGMTINTITTIDDNRSAKQNAIDQTIGVKGIKKESLLYKVETVATTSDLKTGNVTASENAYTYWNNAYFYDYPGVKYKSGVEKEAALKNIRSLMNVISFEEEDMISLAKEYEDEYVIYTFEVEYEAVSDYVKILLQSAVNNFENVNFKPSIVTAMAKVNKAEIITDRELYVEYEGETGERIVLEIYTSLLEDIPKLEVPDAGKYANITG